LAQKFWRIFLTQLLAPKVQLLAKTIFSNPTLIVFPVAPTIHLDGSQHLTFNNPGSCVSEAENLSFRFRDNSNKTFSFVIDAPA
jgi:hypothetical protein